MRGVQELSEEIHIFREFLREQGERELVEDGEELGSEDENENEQKGKGEERVAPAGNVGEGASAVEGAAAGPAADVAVGVDGESA